MEEMEEGKCDAKRNANNVTMNTFYDRSPVTINTQRKNSNVTNERHIPLNILAEKIK